MSVPVVSQVDPATGPATGGVPIVITGTGFTGATAVGFAVAAGATTTLPASFLTVVGDTQITVAAPAGAGTVNVLVTTPGGTSAISASAQFTYVAATATPAPSSGGGVFVDPALNSQLVGSLLEILRGATSAEARQAQDILLRRLALEGDIVGSRIPPPRNITEIGGYINLLADLGESEMRQQTLAGVLGVAGPTKPLGWVSASQPLAFVQVTNDRPSGAFAATLPLTVPLRSDFASAIAAAKHFLNVRGCFLPLAGPTSIQLPAGSAGGTPPADALPFLGRTLNLAANTALANAATDPLALVRASGTADPFTVAAVVLVAGAPVIVPSGGFDALQCNATSCTPAPAPAGAFVPLGSVLAAAGFYPAQPPPQPANNADSAWSRWINVTGLVSGVTRLGDELSLIYNAADIANSAFAAAQGWIWNGTAFAQA